MTKKPALGRGLSALIPQTRAAETEKGVAFVELELLQPNLRQPRQHFDDEGLKELAESIGQSGILQPVLVTRDGDKYRILAGERRVRAARLAGLTRVPVLLREGVDDRDQLLLALVENVQRRDLTALEEAEAYRHLKDDFGLTQDEVAARVGKDRTTVANALRLLKLPAEIRKLVDEGKISGGHARALVPIASAADQEKIAKEIVEKDLSVRAVEAKVAALLRGGADLKTRGAKIADPDTRDAELRLQRALGTKVEIRRRRKGGEIRISFFSEAELIGLFERLMAREK